MSNLAIFKNNLAADLSSLTPDQKLLFDKVPENGDPVGNKNLRQQLEWDDLKYWSVRDSLVELEFLSTGQGRGGSVYRLVHIVENQQEEIDSSPHESYEYEKDLYKPFTEAMDKWAKELQFANYFIEDTSSQGSRRTGGVWTRPDAVIINVETYQYVPNKYLEVITFEVKPSWGWEISAVFETAAHSRFASRSYLALHKDSSRNQVSADLEARIEEECKRFGVGLIVFTNPANYDTYEFNVEPSRKVYDPREVEKFMEQISTANRTKLSRWLR